MPAPPPRFLPGLRKRLDAWRADDAAAFDRTFRDGEPARPDPLLCEAGLIDAEGRPRVALFAFHGLLVATDRPDHDAADQVFPLEFEQHYLVRNSSVRAGDAVCEPCTGSGAFALFAAARGATVTGTDLGPRALAFAALNRALNGVDPAAARFERGSLYEPLPPGRRFDLVVVNPPFEYVPAGESWFLHSDGGEDGLRVVRACIAGAPDRLAPGGRFEIVTYSPGSETTPALLPLLDEAFPGRALECHVLDVEPIGARLARVDDVPVAGRRFRPGRRLRRARWRRSLERRGLTHNHFLFCRVGGGPGDVRVVKPLDEIEACERLSAG